MSDFGPVLFLDHTTALGGAELSLARFLRSEVGSSASLAFLTPESAQAWDLPESVRVSHTRGTAGATGIRGLVAELTELVEDIDPAVIVANSFSAAQYLAFVPKRGRRYAYFLRQAALPLELPRTKAILNRLFVLRRFDWFLANSAWTAGTLPRSVPRGRVLLSHPISGVRVQAGLTRPSDLGPIRMLAMSRLSPWKGVHTAIEAVRIANSETPGSAELTIAGGDLFGEADYSARLRRLAADTDVRFVGHQSDTAPLLRSADVLVCLSTTPEPFGQVVVQGMASGHVVIATDQGGPKEVIEHGVNGFLVPPEAPWAVAEIISSLHADPGLVKRIAGAAQERARAFEDTVTIPAFSEALRTIVAGGRA